MAALPGSGSDGGFFLLKGSFFSPQSPRAAQDGIGSERSAIYWFPELGNCFNWLTLTLYVLDSFII